MRIIRENARRPLADGEPTVSVSVEPLGGRPAGVTLRIPGPDSLSSPRVYLVHLTGRDCDAIAAAYREYLDLCD